MRDTVRVGVSLIRQAQRGVFTFSMKAVNYRYSSKQSLSPAVFPPFPYAISHMLCHMAGPSSGSGARVTHHIPRLVQITLSACNYFS